MSINYEVMQEQDLVEFGIDHEISPQLPVVKELRAIGKGIKELAEKEMPEMPMEHKMVFPDGISVVTLKGDKGDQGEKGEQGERGLDGNNGKDGINGKDGRDGLDGLNGIDGKDGKDGQDGSPDTGEQIIDKINEDESDKVIKKEKVEGLMDELARIERVASTKPSMPSRRVYQPKLDRFTAQTDGVTKTFTLTREPLDSDTIEVSGTDFPIILDPTVDFTVSGKTLTLSANIPAPSSGATLIVKYYT